MNNQQGLSIIELMIGLTLGLVVTLATLGLYLAQTKIYKTANSQAYIQNSENAIGDILATALRSAGFTGCSTNTTAVSNLNGGGPPPLGNFTSVGSSIYGYDANNSNFTIAKDNAANDTNVSDWTPTLDSTLSGLVAMGSDVIVLLTPVVNASPITVTSIANNSANFTLQNVSGLATGQVGSISDCLKSDIFQITGISGTTITHNTSSGYLGNANANFTVNFAAGAQFIPLQQMAFFVSQDVSGESSLMQAIFQGSSWTVQPIVPGVETLQVSYGVGSNGIITNYVSANAVTDWTKVYAVRLGFLLQGKVGSGSSINNTAVFTVIQKATITTPADNRLRHVYETTVYLRNSQ